MRRKKAGSELQIDNQIAVTSESHYLGIDMTPRRRCEMPDGIPPQVRKLLRREREIATIVYVCGSMSANDVQARLSAPITNAAVRSMLNRLVKKGILNRRLSDGGRIFLYAPAITTEHVLMQLSYDYFDGSLLKTAFAVIDLLKQDQNAVALLAAELASEHHGRLASPAAMHLAA